MSVAHYENFPVASLLCPRQLRPAVVAIYRFARTADDIADEGLADGGQRMKDLSDYRDDLRALFDGTPPSPRWRGLFDDLERARQDHALPLEPLEDLLSAFAQDTANPQYRTRHELLDYCRRSANPIGRLLLHLYRVQDPDSLARADAICTALQLINFWQDLSVDLPRGRHYVPDEDLARHGLKRQDLEAGHDTPATQALVAALCEWARYTMAQGSPLALRLPGRVGWELRLVVQGGLRILQRIARLHHRTLSTRPTLRPNDLPGLAWGAIAMGASRGTKRSAT